jgi:hypothetical protein
MKNGFKQWDGRNNWFIECYKPKSSEELVYVMACWSNCILYLNCIILGLGAETASKQSGDPNVWQPSAWFAYTSYTIRSSCMGAQCQRVNLSLHRLKQTRRLSRPEFPDNLYMRLAWLSALRPDQLFTKEIFLVLNSVTGGVDPRGRSAARMMKSKKNPNETIGNRTRDSPTPSREYLFRLIISVIFLI